MPRYELEVQDSKQRATPPVKIRCFIDHDGAITFRAGEGNGSRWIFRLNSDGTLYRHIDSKSDALVEAGLQFDSSGRIKLSDDD